MLESSPFGGERLIARSLQAEAVAAGEGIGPGLSWEPSLICIRFAIYALLAGAFASSAALVAFAPEQPWRIAGPLLGALVAVAAWLFLSHGRHATSVSVLSIGSWLTITAVAAMTGGAGAPIAVAYPVMIVIIGWVHGARTAAIVTIVSMVAVVGFVAAETLGLLPVRPVSIPSLRGVILIVVIALSSAMIAALVRAYLERVAELHGIGNALACRAMELERQQADLYRAQAVANTGSWVYDAAASRLRLSTEACRIFGVPEGTAGSYSAYLAMTHAEDRRKVEAAWQKAMRKRVLDIEHRIVVGNAARWIRQRAEVDLAPDGSLRRVVGVSQDISDRKASEEEIRQLAFYDTLTGLPNRRLLRDRLQQALASSARDGSCGALFLIDLDGFKMINDSLGHDVGDSLLTVVADRLRECVRECDTVARLGGDEFVVILETLGAAPHEAAVRAEGVADKILAALGRPHELDGRTCMSTPSIGITLFAGHEATIDELLRRADVAMYQAKYAGRNTLRFFDPEMQAAVTARTALESDLRTAMEHDQLLLHYQVQVDEHERVCGVEALLRWQHPVRGVILPAEFIPVAEESGLIVPMGRRVIAAACEQLAAWGRHAATRHLTLAVNVSARQFREDAFVSHVQDTLAQSGAAPEKLKLELTESLMLDNVEETIAKMNALKCLGVSFSLDDFGTGYSSLSYLKRLPLDQLKIDRSFVRDILVDANDAAIARTIVALAQSLGLTVIAEGVETGEQREMLARFGCRACQGYLFGRPEPAADIGRRLAAA